MALKQSREPRKAKEGAICMWDIEWYLWECLVLVLGEGRNLFWRKEGWAMNLCFETCIWDSWMEVNRWEVKWVAWIS